MNIFKKIKHLELRMCELEKPKPFKIGDNFSSGKHKGVVVNVEKGRPYKIFNEWFFNWEVTVYFKDIKYTRTYKRTIYRP